MPPDDTPASQKNKSDIIKDKFLLVAKEKSRLESLILEQSDTIKTLEKERDSLSLSLNKYAASNQRIKEKLLELDKLRNSEIADMRKKIEMLLSENRELLDEKNALLTENPPPAAGRESDARKEQSRLPDMTQELRHLLEMKEHNLAAASERVRQLEQEIASLHTGLKTVEDERNRLKEKITAFSQESASSGPEARYTEQELEQEIDFYSKEILSLKSDIDIFTATIKDKSRQIESLKNNIEELGKQLRQKDATLYEKIPLLQAAMQQLSHSIEKKTIDNSSFGREIAELGGRLSVLTDEIAVQENILQEISENFATGKDRFTELGQKYEEANKLFEEENAELRDRLSALLSEKQKIEAEKNQREEELDDLKSRLAGVTSQDETVRLRLERLEEEKRALELKLAESTQKVEGLEANIRSNLAVLESKDQFIMETNAEAEALKAELLRRDAERQEVESAKNRLETELAHLQAGLPDLKAEIELLRSEKYRIETEKDQIGAEREELRARLEGLQTEDSEFRQRFSGLEDERQALESKLSAALQKIDELVADALSHQALLDSKERGLAEADTELTSLRNEINALESGKQDIETERDRMRTEIAELKARLYDLQSEDSEFRQRFSGLEDERQALESKLSTALQKIDELVADALSHQALLESKDRLLMEGKTEREELSGALASLDSDKQRLEAERNQLGADLAGIRSELQQSREQGRENGLMIGKLQEEKQALEADLLSGRQKISEMEEEINRHVSSFESHKQLFSDLKSEAERDRSALDALEKEHAALQDRLSRKELEFSSYASEKSELLKKVSVLEEAFRILHDDSDRERTAGSQASQGPVNIVPAAIYQNHKTRSLPRYAFIAVLLVAVVAALVYFSRNSGVTVITRSRPPVTADADATLSYRDIYDRNTRTADAKGIRLQATVFTESLSQKEENEDRTGFDFNNYIYFRVNINALEGQLDQDLVRNPLENLKLTEDSRTIATSGYKQIDRIKTFYKRQLPTSITFYCAFPKDALGPDRKDLTLTLIRNGNAIPLVWDVQNLIANRI